MLSSWGWYVIAKAAGIALIGMLAVLHVVAAVFLIGVAVGIYIAVAKKGTSR